MLAGSASINAAVPGFLEGHLKIISPKGVELAMKRHLKRQQRTMLIIHW
jgi:hypothetical protein